MRVVVQKCLRASVNVNQKLINEINEGLMILVCFTDGDNETNINWMVNKITHLRIFDDENKVMNYNVLDINGSILSISQFTLYGDANNGNRPSYIKALNGEKAIKLYDMFNAKLGKLIQTKTGIFGADMQIELINNGPTTIILEK